MKDKTITEIKHMLNQSEMLSPKDIQFLKNDQRKGVHKLLASYEKRLQAQEQLEARYKEMCQIEQSCFARGCHYVAGVDEAGRGPLAGPVVAAAVILPSDFRLLGLNDSKQLSAAKREEFYHVITQNATSYGISAVGSEKIDEINIYEATKLAMTQAIDELNPQPDHVLLDAVSLDGLRCTSEALIKGDCKSVSIAAASVLAKVTRDRIMQQLHSDYPQYQFEQNMGYGTKHHINMLREKGLTPYHRKTFSPVNQMYDKVK